MAAAILTYSFQNIGGTVAFWEMNGTNVIASPVVGNPGSGWQVIRGE